MSTKQALVLVAHADDETLGCGGIIQKLLKAGWAVEVVIISDGILTVRGSVQDNSYDAVDACEVLGLPKPKMLGYKDQHFDVHPVSDIASAFVERFGGFRPDLIVTHSDQDLNKDHRITCEVAKIIGRPKRKPVSILGCEVPSTSFWNGHPFQANYYVDITSEIDCKIEAFSRYRNELQAYPHPWSERGLRLLAEYHGMQCGFQYAEAFQVIRAYEGLLL